MLHFFIGTRLMSRRKGGIFHHTVNRWIFLFFGLMISFLLLMLVPAENFVLRSVSITIIAVLSICYYLHNRYSRKLSIQSDLLVSISTLVQFLIPVFYLSYYYELNPDLDIQSYRYGYAITSFAVLLGQISFFCGYESVKKSIVFPRIIITESSVSNFFIVLFPLLILIWIGRFVLLSTGTYYFINRTDYQFSSPYYSVVAQLDGYGLIIVGGLFLIAFTEKNRRNFFFNFTIAFTVFLLEILWYGFAGLREPLAKTIIAPIFAYIFIKREIPKKTLAVIVLVGLPLFAILGEYRYTASTFGVSEISPLKTIPVLIEANKRLDSQDVIANLADRFYDGKSLGYLLTHYPHDYDYEFGATYINIPFILIPRFIYTDKPIFTMGLGKWYDLMEYSSMPTTFWGESFINFSWVGIIIIPYIAGLLLKGYDFLFIKRSSKTYWAYLYVFGAVNVMRLPVEPAVIWISFFLKVIVLAFIFTWIHSAFTKVVISR